LERLKAPERGLTDDGESRRRAREQRAREEREQALRDLSPEPGEARAHDRRAEKAAYLRQRLEEQADAAGEGEGDG
jgi:hypothetical protein